MMGKIDIDNFRRMAAEARDTEIRQKLAIIDPALEAAQMSTELLLYMACADLAFDQMPEFIPLTSQHMPFAERGWSFVDRDPVPSHALMKLEGLWRIAAPKGGVSTEGSIATTSLAFTCVANELDLAYSSKLRAMFDARIGWKLRLDTARLKDIATLLPVHVQRAAFFAANHVLAVPNTTDCPGRVETAREWIEKWRDATGIDLNDLPGSEPMLMQASRMNNWGTFQAMLAHGLNPDAEFNGETILDHVLKHDNFNRGNLTALLSALKEQGRPLRSAGPTNPLRVLLDRFLHRMEAHHTIVQDVPQIFTFLVEHGVNPAAIDQDGVSFIQELDRVVSTAPDPTMHPINLKNLVTKQAILRGCRDQIFQPA